MIREYFVFTNQKEAEDFSKLETPIEGVNIGKGIHVPKEMSLTTHSCHVVKHQKEEKWLVPVVEETRDKVEFTKEFIQFSFPK